MLLQHVVITLNDGTRGVFTGRALVRTTDAPRQITNVEFSEPVEIPVEGADPLVRIQAAAAPPTKVAEPAPPVPPVAKAAPAADASMLFAQAVDEHEAAKKKRVKKKRAPKKPPVKGDAGAAKH